MKVLNLCLAPLTSSVEEKGISVYTCLFVLALHSFNGYLLVAAD